MPDPAFSQLPAENKRQLRDALSAAFNADELKTLCVDLRVDYDNLAGNNKAGRIRELVDLLDREDRISDLVEAAERERPNGNWREQIQLTPTPNTQPIEPPSALVAYIDQHATELEMSGEIIRKEIAKYFKMVDDRVNNKYKLGFISPVQNNERVRFQSEKLVRSLLKLNITLNVALKILAETVTTLDLLLISEQVDVANNLKTSHIRESVVQSIYRLSNIYGQTQVQTWGDRYARRFGGPHHRIQVIHSNGDVEELSYSFIKNYLLPDIFQRLFYLDFDKFKADILPAEHTSIMAQSVVEYVRSIDLYHIRYDFLVDLVTEIGIQPPHPWFAPEQFAKIVIDYDLERIQYHKVRANFFVGQDDTGSIMHHCKELIHHSCSALLSNYGCYLGCFNLASLRVLIGMIEYHAASRFDESDGYFRFKQFFGDLVSTLDIDHERFVQKLKRTDRYLSQDPVREGHGLQTIMDFCFELSVDITQLISRRKAVIQFVENYDKGDQSQKQLLEIAHEVLIRVPGIRFAPKQDDVEHNILWAYHDLTSAVFQQISPKFAISVLTGSDEVMLAVSIDNVLSHLSRQMPPNQATRTVLFVTQYADTVQTVISDYIKNYDLKVNSFTLSLTDLIAISENQNRLETLSDLLREQ